MTRDVPDYALVIGVAVRRTGWMSRHSHRLVRGRDDGDELLRCPESGYRSRRTGDEGRCLDLDEDALMPALRVAGALRYRERAEPAKNE